jgi:hypothetical protein
LVVFRELNVLILDKLVDDSTTVRGRDLLQGFFDIAMISTKFVQFVLELLEWNVLRLRRSVRPRTGVPRFL